MEYRHRSRIGTFIIREIRQGSGPAWVVECAGERLGSYYTPQAAAEEVAGGSCDWPGITDPADLGISDDLGDWETIGSPPRF